MSAATTETVYAAYEVGSAERKFPFRLWLNMTAPPFLS